MSSAAPAVEDRDTFHGRPVTFIDGAWRDSDGATVTVTNPATGSVLAQLTGSSDAEVREAIISARRTFDAGDPTWTPQRRSQILHQLADRIETAADDLAAILTAEVGAPVKQAKTVHVVQAAACIRYFAEVAVEGPLGGWERPLGVHRGGGITSSSVIVQEPLGVVSALLAYNYPLLLAARKIGAVIASGCTTVVMPSVQAPLAFLALMDIIADLDLPAGRINCVLGDIEAGKILSTDPMVDMVSFTGSEHVGSAIMSQAAPTLKKLVLELGGKSPNLILPGCDLDTLIGPSLMRFSLMAGQGCGATTRVVVHRDDYDQYVELAAAHFAQMRVGDPTDPGTDVGPLISTAHRGRVAGFVERALEEGGTVAARAALSSDDLAEVGTYFEPQLIASLPNSAEISQEELFGPVATLLPYDTVEEAIEIANGTRFALNANVWGRTSEALELIPRFRSGTVTINGGGGMRHDVGWGGPGASGVGREAGDQGFAAYLEEKHVQWPVDGGPFATGGKR